jgi:hypothetical protein
MSSVRLSMLLLLLVPTVSVWPQQTLASPGQPQGPDSSSQTIKQPEALTVVQEAITALGGATAIGQAQNWTFQAQMQGPRGNGSIEYAMSTHTDRGQVARMDGTTQPARAIESIFVLALVGSILLKESQDTELSIHYSGASSLNSNPVTVLTFSVGLTQVPAQIWYFDANNLPVQVDFRLPAEIGARRSLHGMVSLSDYRQVSAVMYPFRIVAFMPGQPPEVLTIDTIATDKTASVNQFNGPGGDLR